MPFRLWPEATVHARMKHLLFALRLLPGLEGGVTSRSTMAPTISSSNEVTSTWSFPQHDGLRSHLWSMLLEIAV